LSEFCRRRQWHFPSLSKRRIPQRLGKIRRGAAICLA